MTRGVVAALLLFGAAARAAAQGGGGGGGGGGAFVPPPVQPATHARTRLGFFGFGARAGADANNGGQFVAGLTLDLGDLRGSKLRLRPSGEIGVGNGANSYSASLEVLYRLMPMKPW